VAVFVSFAGQRTSCKSAERIFKMLARQRKHKSKKILFCFPLGQSAFMESKDLAMETLF